VIDRTNESVNTELANSIIQIMSTNPILDKYTIYTYLPELNYIKEGVSYVAFEARNDSNDRKGILVYGCNDKPSFISVKAAKKRACCV